MVWSRRQQREWRKFGAAEGVEKVWSRRGEGSEENTGAERDELNKSK